MMDFVEEEEKKEICGCWDLGVSKTNKLAVNLYNFEFFPFI
jgi:hypothetical protein